MTIFTKSRTSEDEDFVVLQEMNADWTSKPISGDLQISLAIACFFIIGDATGILTLEASCGGTFFDGSPDVTDWIPITVVTLTSGVFTAVNGSPVPAPLLSANCMYETTSAANWFRLRYTSTSGDGNLSASWVKKTYA